MLGIGNFLPGGRAEGLTSINWASMAVAGRDGFRTSPSAAQHLEQCQGHTHCYTELWGLKPYGNNNLLFDKTRAAQQDRLSRKGCVVGGGFGPGSTGQAVWWVVGGGFGPGSTEQAVVGGGWWV